MCACYVTIVDNVRVGDLLKGFNMTRPSLGALKKRLTVVEDKNKPIAPPLSKVKADQVTIAEHVYFKCVLCCW